MMNRNVGSTVRRICAMLYFSVVAAGATYSTSGLIDVPTDEYLANLQLEVDFSAAVSKNDMVPHYANLNAVVGIYQLAELGIAVNSLWEKPAVVGNAKFEVLDEEHYWRFMPALSVGVDNITTSSDVSSAGARHPDDDAAYGRPFADKLSFFVVSTKHLYPLGVFHIGWGRGRFVGDGPYSKYFRGVFLGYERRVAGPVAIMVEADGRDINAGVRLEFGRFAVVAAGEKLEQIGRDYNPYFSISLEASNKDIHVGAAERLGLRRKANDLETEIRRIQADVNLEAGKIRELQAVLEDLEREYRNYGVDTAEIERMRGELEDLRTRAAEEEGGPEPGI